MPNFYTHLKFGRLVLRELPDALRRRLEGERDAYFLGQFGPDPLFFYNSITGGAVRKMGVAMHRQSPRDVLERLREEMGKGTPFAAGYAAGFFCHYALDSRCHVYVKGLVGENTLTHSVIEVEFDRFLMERDGIDPTKETPMRDPAMPRAFYELLSRAVFPGVQGAQFQKCMRFYYKLNRWHTRAAGSRAAQLVLGLAARTSRLGARAGNLALKRKPEEAFAQCNGVLLAMLEDEVDETAGQLASFFFGERLGAWLDRDFNGRPLPGRAGDGPGTRQGGTT